MSLADPCANLTPAPDFSIRRVIFVFGRGVDESALNHGNNSVSGRIETMISSVLPSDFLLLSMVKVGKVTFCVGCKDA